MSPAPVLSCEVSGVCGTADRSGVQCVVGVKILMCVHSHQWREEGITRGQSDSPPVGHRAVDGQGDSPLICPTDVSGKVVSIPVVHRAVNGQGDDPPSPHDLEDSPPVDFIPVGGQGDRPPSPTTTRHRLLLSTPVVHWTDKKQGDGPPSVSTRRHDRQEMPQCASVERRSAYRCAGHAGDRGLPQRQRRSKLSLPCVVWRGCAHPSGM